VHKTNVIIKDRGASEGREKINLSAKSYFQNPSIMVFLHVDSFSDPNELPQGYGYDFKDGKYEGEEPLNEEDTLERFPDVTVCMPNGHFTHRFVWKEYPESEGVRIIEGQTYEGVGC
jgi:hypothetical protein